MMKNVDLLTNEYFEINDVSVKQKILLYILRRFHNICDENGLIYNAFGGTMLGAIRHKGFIPWDDDIDVTMPREDYNRFIEIVRNMDDEDIIIHCYPDENYIYPYAKLGLSQSIQLENVVKNPYNKLTINIDIFPVDGYPTDEREIDQYTSLESNIILCTYKMKVRRPGVLLKKWYSMTKGYKFFVYRQIELASRNSIKQCTNVICHGAGWGKKGIVQKSKYYDRVLYDFEDTKIWGMKDFDEHMTRLYGDYMKMPPLEKRNMPHDNYLLIRKSFFESILTEE